MPYAARGDSGPRFPRIAAAGRAIRPSLVQGLQDVMGGVHPAIGAMQQITSMSRTRVSSTPSNAPAGGQFAYKAPQMNPANIHALRRAMRRLERAEKLYSKIFQFRHGPTHKHVTVRHHPKKGK